MKGLGEERARRGVACAESQRRATFACVMN